MFLIRHITGKTVLTARRRPRFLTSSLLEVELFAICISVWVRSYDVVSCYILIRLALKVRIMVQLMVRVR